MRPGLKHPLGRSLNGLSLFVSWMLTARLAAMGFSPEGHSSWLLKTAPISPANLVISKLLVAYLPSLALGWIFLVVIWILQHGTLDVLLFSLAVMLPEIFQGGNFMEIYALLPQVLVFGAAYAFFTTHQIRWVFFTGALTGLAFMTKQPTIGMGLSAMGVIFLVSLLQVLYPDAA